MKYEVGEEINNEISKMFQEGVKEGLVRNDIKLPLASFIFGLVFWNNSYVAGKNKYLAKSLGISSKDFYNVV